MLTSEKAALSKAEAIYQEEARKQEEGQNTLKYLDQDFGPRRKSDEHGKKMSMYKTGEMPRKGYPDPGSCEWVFADELCAPGQR